MRLATFNCNSIRSRLGQVLDWLGACEPDLLALQETKAQDSDFPAAAFAEAGWQVAFCGEKRYNGVACVTRQAPDEVSFGLDDGDDGQSATRLCHIRLGDLHVINTYVPQGRDLDSEQFAFKLAWFARLRRWFEARFDPARDRVAWLGDLNVAPTPADVHDSKKVWPHVCHCEAVIAAFDEVVDWGFRDVFRAFLPEAGIFTYWDYRVPQALDRGVGWRIDHVLATAPLADTATACVVDTDARRREKPSDHTFVYADFA
jgi:exodeoxyribonuclease-3